MTNVLHYVNPQLINEWDFIKNKGIDYFKVTKGTRKIKPWWICPKCRSVYDCTVPNRLKGHACPYCAGKKVNHTNSLATLNPQLASEWHPTRNGKWNPDNVSCNKKIRVWWLGWCGHEWIAPLPNRSYSKHGCPYCCNRLTLKGYNDIWTTNPELGRQLLNKEIGYKYMQNSGTKVDWLCDICFTVSTKKIFDVNRTGLSCPGCSDGISYPQKAMFNLLKHCRIETVTEIRFPWLPDRFYDFYLPKYSILIETHGEQHYESSNFHRDNRKTLKNIQEVDLLKKNIALTLGINDVRDYIIIDCRESNINFIRNNIENSALGNILDLTQVDWKDIDFKSRQSYVKIAVLMYKEGYSKKQIGLELGLHHKTIHRYLKKMNVL